MPPHTSTHRHTQLHPSPTPMQPAELGPKATCTITIIDDDFPGIIGFKDPDLRVIESTGKAVLRVERTGGARGKGALRL